MGAWFEMYSTWETLGVQLLAALFVIGSYYAGRVRQGQAPGQAGPRAGAEGDRRPRRELAAARRLSAEAVQLVPMPGDLTVEQLAHETSMSVRNIRNHQSRGLLPPPEVRARIGYYGPEHVERLRLIQEMQAEGFNLEAIKRLLGDDGVAASRLLGVKRVISTPEAAESPEILTRRRSRSASARSTPRSCRARASSS